MDRFTFHANVVVLFGVVHVVDVFGDSVCDPCSSYAFAVDGTDDKFCQDNDLKCWSSNDCNGDGEICRNSLKAQTTLSTTHAPSRSFPTSWPTVSPSLTLVTVTPTQSPSASPTSPPSLSTTTPTVSGLLVCEACSSYAVVVDGTEDKFCQDNDLKCWSSNDCDGGGEICRNSLQLQTTLSSESSSATLPTTKSTVEGTLTSSLTSNTAPAFATTSAFAASVSPTNDVITTNPSVAVTSTSSLVSTSSFTSTDDVVSTNDGITSSPESSTTLSTTSTMTTSDPSIFFGDASTSAISSDVFNVLVVLIPLFVILVIAIGVFLYKHQRSTKAASVNSTADTNSTYDSSSPSFKKSTGAAIIANPNYASMEEETIEDRYEVPQAHARTLHNSLYASSSPTHTHDDDDVSALQHQQQHQQQPEQVYYEAVTTSEPATATSHVGADYARTYDHVQSYDSLPVTLRRSSHDDIDGDDVHNMLSVNVNPSVYEIPITSDPHYEIPVTTSKYEIPVCANKYETPVCASNFYSSAVNVDVRNMDTTSRSLETGYVLADTKVHIASGNEDEV